MPVSDIGRSQTHYGYQKVEIFGLPQRWTAGSEIIPAQLHQGRHASPEARMISIRDFWPIELYGRTSSGSRIQI